MHIIPDTSDTRDSPTSARRSWNMRAIKRVDTKPELELRSALHRRRHRFRKDFRIDTAQRRARPDVVFTRRRACVFVDGCFWYSCPIHGRRPSVNQTYWTLKLATTSDRDKATNQALVTEGWIVIRVWEHVSLAAAIDQIERVLADRAACGSAAQSSLIQIE